MADTSVASRDKSSILPIHFIEQIPDMVFIMSVHSARDFRYHFMNPSAMAASGLNTYAYGATIQDVVEPAEASFLHDQYTRALSVGQSVSFVLNHEGQIGESRITPVRDETGQISCLMGIVRDITDRVRREQQLEYLAFRDQLTGLFNRHAVTARLQHAARQADEEGKLMALFLVDSDNLKLTNDRYGHITGDLMLREIASRLLLSVPTAHTVARMGGDEFLLAVLVDDEFEAFESANCVMQVMRCPWMQEEKALSISVSVGIGMYPIDATELTKLIEAADKGLYISKERGGNQYMLNRLQR